jgi:hypothetical protein
MVVGHFCFTNKAMLGFGGRPALATSMRNGFSTLESYIVYSKVMFQSYK